MGLRKRSGNSSNFKLEDVVHCMKSRARANKYATNTTVVFREKDCRPAKYIFRAILWKHYFVGAIINLFSTNGFIPNHFGNCTNDETISSGTDNMNNILTDHSDNESVKDQDNHVSRPSTPLQPFVSY